MTCRVALLTVVCLVTLSVTSANDWTALAFPIKSHDFGTVAVAAQTEFRFPVINPLESTMHIQSVRASCGCTTPTIEKSYLNPKEQGAIHAKFNTHSFKGQKGATLTVVIDQPFYSEVQLRVDGYIRSDIVVSPGAIDFGTIPQGRAAQKSSKLYYAGRDSWEIVDAQSNRPWLQPEVKELSRGGGRVNYELTVHVREDATGSFADEVVIITNDKTKPRIPIRVTGQIDTPLTVSPSVIALGSLKPGEPAEQRLVLIGRAPFTVTSITVDGWNVEFNATPEAKTSHIVLAKFIPTGEKTGEQKSQIEIKAEGGESIQANAILTANVLTDSLQASPPVVVVGD